jgi:UDPglucose 6-dehydrogenase/GDP-mannose 6-dehydrogenase
VIQALLENGAKVTAFDPIARGEAEKHFGKDAIHFANSLEEAVGGAKAVLLMTRWPEFNRLTELLATGKEAPVLIDGRRVIPKTGVPCYEGIGIGPAV